MDNHTETTPLASRIMETIDTGAVTPKSRAYFLVQKFGLSLLIGSTVGVGSVVIATILFRVRNIPYMLPPEGVSFADMVMFLVLVPVLWVVLMGAVVLLGYQEIRVTERGYRHTIPLIVLSLIGASMVLGTLLTQFGIGARMDRAFGEHMFRDHSVERAQSRLWFSPARGVLVGEIEALGTAVMHVRAPDGSLWNVTIGDSVGAETRALLAAGGRIGMRGMLMSDSEFLFRACDIRMLKVIGVDEYTMPRVPPRIDRDHERGGVLLHERKNPVARSIECEARTASSLINE